MTEITRQPVRVRRPSDEYSRGNQGHDFTAVLTDTGCRVIIAYLKTL